MLSPKQLRLVRPTHNVTLAHGSIRSGKTLAELIAFVDWIANQAPPGPLAIIGITRDTINRNLLEQLDLLDPAICSWSPYGNTCQIMGRTVHRISSNDSKAETKIRGLTLAGALLDEATLVHEATFIQLLGRLSIPGSRLFATTNPDNPAHWLKTKYINRADELGWNVQHFTMRDNPGLTPEYIEAKEREFTGLYYRRFIQGEWVAAEGAVYPDFDRDKHVVPFLDLPPARMALSVGLDYGTTNASSALALYLGEDNRLYLTDEWRVDQGTRLAAMTDAELSRSFTTWLADPHHPTSRHPFSQFFVDPAAASFKTQLHRDGVRHVKNANNNVAYGIKLVASLIAADRLRVSDKCTGLLEEIGGYRWDQKASERGEDKPVKTDDHCLVAGTLVTTDNGPTPIENIKPGTRVLTRAGWRAVTDAWQVSASTPVLTVKTTAGRVLTGTGNHRVWVSGRGWTRIDALRYLDTLEVCPEPAHDYVDSVTAAGTAPVYDLTVDGEHEFYANQLLVHNSVDAARYAITSSESWWRRYIPSI